MYEIEGFKFKCPRHYVEHQKEAMYLISLYSHYIKGFLWCDGGISQQPAYYASAMEFISNKQAQMDDEEMKKDK